MKWIKCITLSILIICIIPLANAQDTPFGYQFLDNGEVLNIWNPSLNYYFNTSSGLQFTNNYNDYWSKNIFCVGWKTGGIWVDRCNDGSILKNFNWTIETDNLSYVTLQGYKTITFDGKASEIGLNYTLNTSYNDLIITPSLKNIDTTPITDEIRFKWRIQDINIGDGFNNYAIGDGAEINLSKNWDISRTNITPKEFMIYKLDSGKWFKISWDYGQNNISVKNESSQYNAPITLILNDTGLNVNQKKQTNLYWIDALCTINMGATTPIEQQKLINGDDTRFLSSCDKANTGCPSAISGCQPKLEVATRKDGASFSLLTSGDAQDYVCENYLGANYQFTHNNKTDIRGCFRIYIDVLGICQPSANCFSTNIINDVWLNNHTPITSNVTLTIFNDTYIYTNGVNQYVNISSTVNPNFANFLKQNFTISLWIKINDTDTSVITAQQDGAGIGRTILVNRPVACGTHLGSNIKGVNTCFVETLSVNTWYNPVLIYNGTSLSLYLNGVYSNSSVLAPDENANGNIILGANKNLAQLFNGSVDNLIYYNRTLNDAEILDLYNKGRVTNPTINRTKLINWFTFDEGNGVVSYDYVTTGYANLTNGVSWITYGANSTYCNYNFTDGDNVDNQNTAITIIKWFFQGKILKSEYNNLTYINTTSNQYVCCVKTFDDVYATGTESFVCSGELNKDVIFAIIIVYTSIVLYLLILSYHIREKHKIISLSIIFLSLYLLLYIINTFNYFISYGYFKTFYSSLIYSYWVIVAFTFITIITGIIKKLGGKT